MQRKYLIPRTVWGLLSLLICVGLAHPAWSADASDAEVASEADVGHGDADHEAGHGDDGHGDDGHGDSAGSTNPITLDPDLAIVTAIIFLLLLAILWKFAWGPVIEALDRREQSVANQLAEAKANHEQAQQMLAEHETKLASAAAEVKQMLDEARKDADVQKQQILESAQAAASAEKDRAIREIDAAKNAALQDMAKKSVDTAVGLAGQIVKRQLSPDDHSNLIGDALDRFGSN